ASRRVCSLKSDTPLRIAVKSMAMSRGHGFPGRTQYAHCTPLSRNIVQAIRVYYDVDALDYSQIDDRDIRNGTNVIKTDQGDFAVTQAVNYASVVPGKTAKTFACYGDEVVGVQSCAGRFTWITIPLSNAFGGLPPAAMSATDLPYGHNVHGIPPDALLMPLLERAGVQPPVTVSGSRTMTLVHEAADGGVLIFVITLEDETAAVTIKPRQAIADAVDIIAGKTLAVHDHSFAIDVPAHSVRVVHARTLVDGT
ncbi:MAG: hypothetical protein QF735_10875, partial [Phycisphaeraceae bacterium]|nr:hypothetical protein [Phycisphaeraceae bacterium]